MDPVTGIMIGTAAAGALGSLLNGSAASKAAQDQIAEARRQFDISREDNQRQSQINASQLDPLKAQRSRGNMALLSAILPQLRNVSFSAPAGMQRYVPQMSGGLRLPEGGFPQEALNFYSQGSRVSSEADFLRTLGIPEATIGRILAGAGYDKSAVDQRPTPPPVPAGGQAVPRDNRISFLR